MSSPIEKGRERTKDYLEAALEEAKKLLPHWAYSAIVTTARARAGGKIKASRRLSALEKAWIHGLRPQDMRGEELDQAASENESAWQSAIESEEPCRAFEYRADQFAKVKKGFRSGLPDGGMHAHALNRGSSKTLPDGAHCHIFVMPGTGNIVHTVEDGYHEHSLTRDGKTAKDGRHSHFIYLTDTAPLETLLGGEHSHEMMVETTGFGASHKHTLILPDGVKIVSLDPQEYVDLFVDINDLYLGAMPHASRIADALNEVYRLWDTVTELMDPPSVTVSESIDYKSTDAVSCRVIKSLAEKRIIYGVVLDPYQVDLQNDWIPPSEIEEAAHDFMKNSRIIGLEHSGQADAQIVESWIVEYPDGQRESALQNLPHKAYRRKFGTDTIHSGAWLAGVQLSEKLWDDHLQGKIGAFSIGGSSLKSQISQVAMPSVEFTEQ